MEDTRMIRNLVFDFGNVLLVSDFDRYLDSIISDADIKHEFRKTVFSKEFTRQLDLGFKKSEELFEELASLRPDLACYIRVFQQRWMEHLYGEMPGMHRILENYKLKGYRLYGLSNWSDMIYRVIRQYPIFGLLDGYVISSEEHLVKPDQAIYERLFDKYGLIPGECIFADDKEENIVAAQHAGMNGIIFHDSLQYEAELNRLLI